MTEEALRASRPWGDAAPAGHSRSRALMGLGAVLLAVLLAGMAFWVFTNRPPGEDSVEAGFARDMVVHHEQAVTMALMALGRTSDPAIATLATDILLTQQNQIGQMLGWLNVWGLPATGLGPRMAWMELSAGEAMAGMAMPMDGAMPGMATPEELARLAELSGDAYDAEFLRLMIPHHRGAIPMAETALERSDNAQVQALARAIVATQPAEVAAMEELLRQKAPVAPAS